MESTERLGKPSRKASAAAEELAGGTEAQAEARGGGRRRGCPAFRGCPHGLTDIDAFLCFPLCFPRRSVLSYSFPTGKPLESTERLGKPSRKAIGSRLTDIAERFGLLGV